MRGIENMEIIQALLERKKKRPEKNEDNSTM